MTAYWLVVCCSGGDQLQRCCPTVHRRGGEVPIERGQLARSMRREPQQEDIREVGVRDDRTRSEEVADANIFASEPMFLARAELAQNPKYR